jgi:hypothetical protein
MSGLRRMNAIRPEKERFLAMQQTMKNNSSAFSKNEMNAARKSYEAEEQGKHAKMWAEHNKKMKNERERGLASIFGGKRRTAKRGMRRTKKHAKRRGTRRQ